MTPNKRPAGKANKSEQKAPAAKQGKKADAQPEQSPAENNIPQTEEKADDNPALTPDKDVDESDGKAADTPADDSDGSFADINASETDKGSEDKDGGTIRIKFLEDGLTFRGKVHRKGDTLEVEVGSHVYENSKDSAGNSWLDIAGDPEAQEKRWGRAMFEEI